jgi:carbamoyl-phosphate synthase small subunit
MKKGYLVLSNGKVYEGKLAGAINDVTGEVVFNTGMTGYQEVLTDPSYYGQIVTMTYPLIGNYGVNNEDQESDNGAIPKGFIVRSHCEVPSNFRCSATFDEYLIKNNITLLYDIDTRALTKLLRESGTMNGVITDKLSENHDNKEEYIASASKYIIKDAVKSVSIKYAKKVGDGDLNIALLDYGAKNNIVRSLVKRGCTVTIFPAETAAEDILGTNPDGIMLSNGPGDPKEAVKCIEEIKKLIGAKPIFGICLGHQLMALANGADTIKLKYGHRGANHPVKDLKQDRTYITSQNHGYAVCPDSLGSSMKVSHTNINDNTVEGVEYLNHPTFTVQFHPEACPGPQDTAYLFDKFIDLVRRNK